MCFAFRATTSIEDQTLDDILTITNIMKTTNMQRPASSAARTQASPVSDKSASDDCYEVDSPEKDFSTSSRNANLTKRAGTAKSAEGKEDDDYAEGEDDEDEDMEESTTTATAHRKRPGSHLVKGSAKKAKTAVISKQTKPSGKGEGYDDLRKRATIMVKEKQQDIDQLSAELEEMQDERDEARLTVTSLKKKLKSQRADEVAKEAKDADDLKASCKEMKVQLRAEIEKKHKAAVDLKNDRHKDEIARHKSRMEEALITAKEAKLQAKELKPGHSSVVQARDKKIDQLESNLETATGVTDQMKREKAKLQSEKEALSKALAQQSDEAIEYQEVIKKLRDNVKKEQAELASSEKKIAQMERAWAADKRAGNERWQIQYDNSQESARRASDTQRSISTATRALNEAILKRDDFEMKLKDAEAENRMLRSSISKGGNSKDTTEG